MKKMMFALVLALAVSVCGAALAEQGVAYGVYNQSGEQPDSLIRVTMNCRATATVSSTRKRSFNATHLTTATKTIAFILMTAFRVRRSTALASSK